MTNFSTSKLETELIDGKLYATGIMTSSQKDLEGERNIITPNALKKAIDKFLGLKILAEHGKTRKYQSRPLGTILKLEYTPKEYEIDTPVALRMEIKVFVEITDKEAIQDILNGNFTGFSLKWEDLNLLYNPRTKQELSTEINPIELTLTKNPANQDCFFKVISTEKMVKDYLAMTWQYEKSNVKIKSIYKNEFNNLFCDLEFKTKQKSAYKIPIEEIKEPIYLKFSVKEPIVLKFKMKSVKNPSDLSIDNLDTKSAKNQLDTALASQISQAIFNEKNEDWKIKPIENYLSFDGIKKIYDQIIKSTTNLYNNFNGTNYGEKNLPEQISQFRDLFAKITLFGWQNVNQNDFDKSVIEKINIPKTYKGLDDTTLENLKNAGKKANLETITQNRQQSLWEGTESNLYQNTMEELANKDGLEYVGVITANDNRVRENHRPNDRKYLKYGANGLNKYSSDYGCRCIYFRGTEAQMLRYGFTKI